jgi:hypothetical protein
MKRGLNIHDGEEQQTMKREPNFVRSQTFGAVQDGMTDRPVGTHEISKKVKTLNLTLEELCLTSIIPPISD